MPVSEKCPFAGGLRLENFRSRLAADVDGRQVRFQQGQLGNVLPRWNGTSDGTSDMA